MIGQVGLISFFYLTFKIAACHQNARNLSNAWLGPLPTCTHSVFVSRWMRKDVAANIGVKRHPHTEFVSSVRQRIDSFHECIGSVSEYIESVHFISSLSCRHAPLCRLAELTGVTRCKECALSSESLWQLFKSGSKGLAMECNTKWGELG